jgi:hypothetical protein
MTYHRVVTQLDQPNTHYLYLGHCSFMTYHRVVTQLDQPNTHYLYLGSCVTTW